MAKELSLYKFQEQAIEALSGGKHLCIASTGSGKGSIALHMAKLSGKPNILIISTASKRDVKDLLGRNDFEAEADAWFPEWRKSLSSFTVISWQGLVKWWKAFSGNINDWYFIMDEVACAKAGVSSLRGKAFLQITSKTDNWTGYTATPMDVWMDAHAYFVACNKIKNKTEFRRRFCIEQTYKGFPEIVGYREEDLLKRWWKDISDTVDTSEMMKELPQDNHRVVRFDPPKIYKQTLKTRKDDQGEMLDTSGALCAYLRKLCFTKQKKQWVSDYIEGLGDNAIVFYNFKDTGNELERIIKKVLPKTARIWRVDGAHHEIPTAETCGKRDVVLCQWQAGAHGLNLQFMNQWLSVEPHYSYSISLQARGRVRRLGQGRPQFYTYLKCDKTIEVDIYEALKNKSSFAEDVWAIKNNLIKEKE